MFNPSEYELLSITVGRCNIFPIANTTLNTDNYPSPSINQSNFYFAPISPAMLGSVAQHIQSLIISSSLAQKYICRPHGQLLCYLLVLRKLLRECLIPFNLSRCNITRIVFEVLRNTLKTSIRTHRGSPSTLNAVQEPIRVVYCAHSSCLHYIRVYM